MPDIGKAYIQIVPSSQGIQGSITKVLNGEASAAGASAGQNITSGLMPSLTNLGGMGGGALATTLVGAFAAFGVASKIKDIIAEGLNAGGALQQSLGGVEAIFGESADKVKKYAENAWQSVGISGNEYMENVTSFSAALISSLGGDTNKAADIANQALIDMGDNANRFGTDMASIQAAYQGFAKGQYTLLDNLKLGYGGTKTEMQRLLADAEKFSGVHYDLENLGDVYEAIHVIQEELNVAGTTANEAATTLQGSAAAMSAAWTDLLGNMALGENIGPSLENLAVSVSAWLFDNFIPMVINILSSLPQMIFGLVTTFGSELLTRLPELFTQVQEGLGLNLGNIITFITEQVPSFISGFTDLFFSALDALGSVDWLGMGSDIITWIWEGINALLDTVPTLLVDIGTKAVDWFTSIDWGKVGTDVINFIFNGINMLFQNIPNILATIGRTALNIVRNIDWIGLGRSVINFIVSGLRALITNIPTTLKNIGSSAIRAFRSIDWWGLGKGIITGIINGIKNFGGMIKDTLVGFAKNAWSSVKNFLGIGSPSRLFANTVGRWIPPGIAVGIESTRQVALDAMQDLNNDIANSIDPNLALTSSNDLLNGAISSGVNTPNYQIVVEAEMDGTPIRTKVGNYVIEKISNDELNAMRFQGAF